MTFQSVVQRLHRWATTLYHFYRVDVWNAFGSVYLRVCDRTSSINDFLLPFLIFSVISDRLRMTPIFDLCLAMQVIPQEFVRLQVTREEFLCMKALLLLNTGNGKKKQKKTPTVSILFVAVLINHIWSHLWVWPTFQSNNNTMYCFEALGPIGDVAGGWGGVQIRLMFRGSREHEEPRRLLQLLLTSVTYIYTIRLLYKYIQYSYICNIKYNRKRFLYSMNWESL